MNEATFWEIIEKGGKKVRDDQELHLESVRKQLVKLKPKDILKFKEIFDKKLNTAYQWDLWNAAYLMNGGCSDDLFVYFRCWLISQGKKTFDSALKNPDSLASTADPDRDDYEFEELWYIAIEAFEEVAEEEMKQKPSPWKSMPDGKQWDPDNDKAVAKRFPHLAKLYLQAEEE